MGILSVSPQASANLLRTGNNLNSISNALQKSLERIETGNKINSGTDDPAGLARALVLRGSIDTNTNAMETNKGYLSDLQGAEAAITTGMEMLSDIRQLAIDYDLAAGDANAQDGIEAQAVELAEGLTSLMDGITVNGAAIGSAALNTTLTTGLGSDYTLAIAEGLSGDVLTGGGNTIEAAAAALANGAGEGATLAAEMDDALATMAGAARGISAAIDYAVEGSNKVLAAQISGFQAEYDAIMKTDDAAESSIVTQLQGRQQAAVASYGVQNAFAASMQNIFA